MNLAAKSYALRAGLTEGVDQVPQGAKQGGDWPMSDVANPWAGFHLQSTTCVTAKSREAVIAQLEAFGHAEAECIVLELPDDIGAMRPVWLLVGSDTVVTWNVDHAQLRQHRQELGDDSLKLLYLAIL